MGASDSKLVFKQGILRLSNEPRIPKDAKYWNSFWELPESAEDVFTLFSAVDIRRARDFSLANIETLILVLTARLVSLKDNAAFPHPDLAPEKEALNCIRVLTRLLPFVFEADVDSWEVDFFWTPRKETVRVSKPEVLFGDDRERKEVEHEEDDAVQIKDVKPFAEELIDVLVDLLFYSNFTVPKSQTSREKVTFAIWQTGIGCNTAIGSSKELESNRAEVLRLLLVLSSKSMYIPSNTLPTRGVPAITYLVTSKDKQIVLSVLCSLLNTVYNYNPSSWKVPYDHMVFKDSREILVTYSLQFVLVLLLYPLPENFPSSSKNNYRHFFGRLHRQQDFQFLMDGILRTLNQPVGNVAYIPGTRKSIRNAPEQMMLLWETLQCNKRFRAFALEGDRPLEFLIPLLSYAVENRADPSKIGIVRMCVFVLQTISAEIAFGKCINKRFTSHETLPQNVRIQGFSGSYADYLIQCIYLLVTSNKGQLTSAYPALLAILNNIAAYIIEISITSSSKMISLFSSMSTPSFLLANESNHELLHAVLEFFSAAIEHQYSNNPNLIYSVINSRAKFESLRAFTLESGQEEIAKQAQNRKDGFNDVNLTGSSRANSLDDIRSPSTASARTPRLSNVPENDDTFAIGDDEDSEDEHTNQPTPSHTSPSPQESRTPSMDSSAAEDAVPMQLRGMSEKARGKMPVGTPSFSRQGSTTSLTSHPASSYMGAHGFAPTAEWIDSWLPLLPLHTVLTVLTELDPYLESPNTVTSVEILVRKHSLAGIDVSQVRVHLFEWSTLSLGWYESLLWSLIFAAEMNVTNQGAVGTWNGTAIKLFRVQEVGREGPSLLQPRGMVDAVGSNLVNRVTSLNLRGQGTEGTASSRT